MSPNWTQVLDQLLIFQNHEDDTLRVDQFLGKIKLELKGFDKEDVSEEVS